MPEACKKKLFDVVQEQKHEHLFYKPNMTPTDRKNMQTALLVLKRNAIDTPKHMELLENVIYLPDAIQIADIPFARKNRKVEPNGKNVFQDGDDIFFLPSALKEQNKEMQKQ